MYFSLTVETGGEMKWNRKKKMKEMSRRKEEEEEE